MIITELIEYLKGLPDDTIVTVIDCDGDEVILDLDEHTEYTDLTGNQFIEKDCPLYNKKFLTIGGNSYC